MQARAHQLAAEGKKVAVMTSQVLNDLNDGVVVLRPPRSNEELAHALYSLLRQTDELNCDVVLTTLPVEQGIGVAIADRLRRAAGPRGEI